MKGDDPQKYIKQYICFSRVTIRKVNVSGDRYKAGTSTSGLNAFVLDHKLTNTRKGLRNVRF